MTKNNRTIEEKIAFNIFNDSTFVCVCVSVYCEWEIFVLDDHLI